MKPETKQKLKKAAKVCGIATGLVALFILGMGVGSCSEKRLQDQTSQKQSKRAAPRLAPFEGVTNYLDYGYVFEGYNVVNPTVIGVQRNDPFNFSYIPKTALTDGTRYVCVLSEAHRYNWGGADEEVIEAVEFGITGTLPDGSLEYFETGPTAVESFTFVIDIRLSQFWSVAIRCWDYVVPVAVYAEHDYFEKVLPNSSVTLPQTWKPLNLFGQSFVDEIYGNLVGVHDERASYMATIPLDGWLIGGSNWFYFTEIRFYFLMMFGVSYMDSAGNVVTASANSFKSLYYCNIVEVYNSVNSTRLSIWWVDYGSNGSDTYIGRDGHWIDDRYRVIHALDSEWIKGVGESSLYPTYDYKQWLTAENSGGGGVPSLDGDGASVFDMLSLGFKSVADMLSVQILPFLTLGTLLFTPLVILIIFAILKVLNK